MNQRVLVNEVSPLMNPKLQDLLRHYCSELTYQMGIVVNGLGLVAAEVTDEVRAWLAEDVVGKRLKQVLSANVKSEPSDSGVVASGG